jgi:hypothetical protein
VTDTSIRPHTPPAPIRIDPLDQPARLSTTGPAFRPAGVRHPLAQAAWGRFSRWPPLAQLLAIFGASRLLCAVIIEVAAVSAQNPAGVGTLHPHYPDLVAVWDGQWYREIAERGYPSSLPIGLDLSADYNAWAFFPLFPYLVRAVMMLGLPFGAASTVVSLLAGYGAVVVLYQLVERSAGQARRLPMVAVAVWCLAPAAPVLQIAYSESVAALLLGGVLTLLLRRHYGWAVPCVLLLGLTRAVAAPLLLVLVWHAAARWRARRTDPFRATEQARLTALVLATAVSTALWPVIVGLATGIPNAFLQTQARWGQRPSDGPFVPWVAWAWNSAGLAGVAALIGILAAGIHLVLGRHGRWLPAELRIWAIAYPLYLLAVTRPITSMWRFLLLDLPLAAVVASLVVRGGWVRRITLPTRIGLLAAGTVIGLSWWTVILLTRIPWADSPP